MGKKDYKYTDKLSVLREVVLSLGEDYKAQKQAFLADIRGLRTKVDVADLYENCANSKNKVKDYEQAVFQKELPEGAPGRTFEDYQITEAIQFHDFEEGLKKLDDSLRELLSDGPVSDDNAEKHRLFHGSVESACKAHALKDEGGVKEHIGALKPLIERAEPPADPQP